MAITTARRSAHILHWAVPAAVISTVAGTLTAVPAAAYTVADGDTPYDIAAQFGVTVDELLAWNGLDRSSVIFPGDTLRVAVEDSAPDAPAPPAVAAASYEIVAGDTMYAIAEAHGLSLDALLAQNGLSHDSIIYPGQILVLDAPVSATAPAVASVVDSPAEAVETAPLTPLDAEQANNAARIIAIGRELGVPDNGIAIALATAMVESWLRNLDWGDRDSLGLFQQRPSAGWGAPEQILDHDRSIRVFYGGEADPNGDQTRGLLDLDDWESMRFTDAAQAVQISAHPERYGLWETQAYQWLNDLE